MKRHFSHTGIRITTILVSMVVGVVAVILCCCILLFLDRYRSAMIQTARTTSAQAVSQVSNTVSNYLWDMGQAMELVEQSMAQPEQERNERLDSFCTFSPDVGAETTYTSAAGLMEC